MRKANWSRSRCVRSYPESCRGTRGLGGDSATNVQKPIRVEKGITIRRGHFGSVPRGNRNKVGQRCRRLSHRRPQLPPPTNRLTKVLSVDLFLRTRRESIG